MDVISDRIDINVLKTTLSTYSPVSGHIKIILETVIYRGEKSLLVLIYSSDSYNLGALIALFGPKGWNRASEVECWIGAQKQKLGPRVPK